MPRTLVLTPRLRALIDMQDGVVTLNQLDDHGFSRHAGLRRARTGRWRKLLPGVLLTSPGEPTRRQRIIAAWLWAGPASAIDGACACAWYGVRPLGMADALVHVVASAESGLRSTEFVVVRRSLASISVGDRGVVPYVDPATAFVVAARNARSPRAALAVLSRGLQEAVVDVPGLRQARQTIGDKYCKPADWALVAVGAGVRSPGEEDARQLVLLSLVLPEPLWNQWLDLGDGGHPVCVDALWLSAGMVHEVNGRRYHAWDLSFENMHARHERLGAAGLIVVPTTPVQLRTRGAEVLRNLERTFMQHDGRGMPAGVRLIDPPDWSTRPSRT